MEKTKRMDRLGDSVQVHSTNAAPEGRVGVEKLQTTESVRTTAGPRNDDGFQLLCASVLPVWIEQLRLAQKRSEQAVFDMIQAFSLLTQLEVPMGDVAISGAQVPMPQWPDTENVERMYRGFQYQDGLNQLLEILVRDMERLSGQLDADPLAVLALGPDHWLERLRSEYVMQEQRLIGANAPSTRGVDKPDDLTFF